MVHGRWKEVPEHSLTVARAAVADFSQANGNRNGDLSLRQQRITTRMLKALRTDLTRIDLSLVQCCPEQTTVGRSGRKFVVTPHVVVNLAVKVTNTGRMSIEPVLFFSLLTMSQPRFW